MEENLKDSDNNLLQCDFVHHKSHLKSSGIEPRSPQWDDMSYIFGLVLQRFYGV
jgi:hypothetical protein